MTPEEKKRVDALLKRLNPANGATYVVMRTSDSKTFVASTETSFASEHGTPEFNSAWFVVATGTWGGDPLDAVLPLGKWVEETPEVKAAVYPNGVSARRGMHYRMQYCIADQSSKKIQWCRGTPPEHDVTVTDEMVKAAQESFISFGPGYPMQERKCIRAMLEAALKVRT